MMQRARRIGFGLLTTLVVAAPAIIGFSDPAAAADERFEVSSIKAVKPTLQATLDAVQKGDIKKAKELFDDYDSAWNGVEVYINTRSKPMYDKIELDLQDRITKAMDAPLAGWTFASTRCSRNCLKMRRSTRGMAWVMYRCRANGANT